MFRYWAGAADKIQGDAIAVGPDSFNRTFCRWAWLAPFSRGTHHFP